MKPGHIINLLCRLIGILILIQRFCRSGATAEMKATQRFVGCVYLVKVKMMIAEKET